jgi:hypothetical protein
MLNNEVKNFGVRYLKFIIRYYFFFFAWLNHLISAKLPESRLQFELRLRI